MLIPDFNARLVRDNFIHFYPYVQCKHYCCNFYGTPLWFLFSQCVSGACIACRKALKALWKLSPITHCNVIALVAESKPFEISIKQHCCKFSNGIGQHDSDVLGVTPFLSTIIIMWKYLVCIIVWSWSKCVLQHDYEELV